MDYVDISLGVKGPINYSNNPNLFILLLFSSQSSVGKMYLKWPKISENFSTIVTHYNLLTF